MKRLTPEQARNDPDYCRAASMLKCFPEVVQRLDSALNDCDPQSVLYEIVWLYRYPWIAPTAPQPENLLALRKLGEWLPWTAQFESEESNYAPFLVGDRLRDSGYCLERPQIFRQARQPIKGRSPEAVLRTIDALERKRAGASYADIHDTLCRLHGERVMLPSFLA
jgi:hypothetical protein